MLDQDQDQDQDQVSVRVTRNGFMFCDFGGSMANSPFVYRMSCTRFQCSCFLLFYDFDPWIYELCYLACKFVVIWNMIICP